MSSKVDRSGNASTVNALLMTLQLGMISLHIEGNLKFTEIRENLGDDRLRGSANLPGELGPEAIFTQH